MGIIAVIAFTTLGAAAGAAMGAKAIRRKEANPGTVAFASAGAIVVGGYMILQWLFLASLAPTDISEVLVPDFFSPGRKEKILLWYAVASAGIAGLVVSAWFGVHRRQA